MFKKTIKKITRWMLYAILLFFAISILQVIVYRFVPIPNTLFMQIRASENDTDIKREWVSIEDISPNMAQAVIASEDNLFMEHNGFDLKAIEKAMQTNEKRGRNRFGASTISQQTAKNAFLWPARSWVRKGLEVYYTCLIELLWSKERIMEVYLNIIELGKGIYGVQQASQSYFKKDAKKLSKAEAALLAVVLPNPIRMSAAHPSNYVKKRQAKILKVMSQIGPIDLNGDSNNSKSTK